MRTLLLLMGCTTVLLIVAVIGVLLTIMPLLKSRRSGTGDASGQQEDIATAPEPVSEEEDGSMTRDDRGWPSVADVGPLTVGDTVHVQLRSGGHYGFTLWDPQSRIYHLRISGPAEKRRFAMNVVVGEDFTVGECLNFWAPNRDWSSTTAPVTRILVEKGELWMRQESNPSREIA